MHICNLQRMSSVSSASFIWCSCQVSPRAGWLSIHMNKLIHWRSRSSASTCSQPEPVPILFRKFLKCRQPSRMLLAAASLSRVTYMLSERPPRQACTPKTFWSHNLGQQHWLRLSFLWLWANLDHSLPLVRMSHWSDRTADWADNIAALGSLLLLFSPLASCEYKSGGTWEWCALWRGKGTSEDVAPEFENNIADHAMLEHHQMHNVYILSSITQCSSLLNSADHCTLNIFAYRSFLNIILWRTCCRHYCQGWDPDDLFFKFEILLGLSLWLQSNHMVTYIEILWPWTKQHYQWNSLSWQRLFYPLKDLQASVYCRWWNWEALFWPRHSTII